MSILTMTQLHFLRRSAKTQRFHTETLIRAQSVGEHSYGVAWLCWMLTNGEPSAALLMHAIAHDAAEHCTGDIPAPVKRGSDAVKSHFDSAEQDALKGAGICLPPLSEHEELVLKLADSLEGLLYTLDEIDMGNKSVIPVMNAFSDYCRVYTTKFPPEHFARTLLDVVLDRARPYLWSKHD
jgi:5'-deoxynucleotidase YfbR-like HD superfamily hydrolase